MRSNDQHQQDRQHGNANGPECRARDAIRNADIAPDALRSRSSATRR